MVPAPKKQVKKRAKPKEERKADLLAAAREVFAAHGYQAASVSDIVKRAGVAHGTFYLYFKSKREVIESLLNDFIREFYDVVHVTDALEIHTVEEMENRIYHVAMGALRVFRKNSDIARVLVMDAAVHDKEFDKKISSLRSLLVQDGVRNFTLWMDRGLLKKGDPYFIQHCVGSLIEGMAMRWLRGELEGELEDIVEEIVAFELYGYVARPSQGRKAAESIFPAQAKYFEGFDGTSRGRYHNTILGIIKLLGGDGLRREAQQKYGRPRYDDEEMYPTREASRMIAHAAEKGVSIERLGRNAARTYQRNFPSDLKDLTPERALELVTSAYSDETSFGATVKILEKGTGYAVIERRNNPVPCGFFVGVVSELYKMIGLPATVRETRCQWRDDTESCMFRIEWKKGEESSQ